VVQGGYELETYARKVAWAQGLTVEERYAVFEGMLPLLLAGRRKTDARCAETLRALYGALASHGVRYVLIGGVAALLHGIPRMARDLDLLIDATLGNAQRTLEALHRAGLQVAPAAQPADLLANEVTTIGDGFTVDVLTRVPENTFAGGWERRDIVTLSGVPLNVLSVEDLIASREARGRREDLEDVEALRRSGQGEG
jgi:predicted nucleotidyltransferase